MRLRDEFGRLYDDEDFHPFFLTRGCPAFLPWRLAFVSVLQFMEQLSWPESCSEVRVASRWR